MISNLTLPLVSSGPPTIRGSGKGGEADAMREASGKLSAASLSGAGRDGADPESKSIKDIEPVQVADVHTAVEDINNHINNIHRDLVFAVDESTHDVVVKVMDRASGEMVRQIPAESVLSLSKHLKDLAGRQSSSGLLVKDQA